MCYAPPVKDSGVESEDFDGSTEQDTVYESDDKQCVHREQRSACTVTFAHVHSCLLHRWHRAFPLHDQWQGMGVVIYWLLARKTRTGEAGGRLEDLKDMGGRRGGPLRLYRGTHFLSP